MNKRLEDIKTDVLIYPTATTAKSGSASVDMANYTHAVAKLFAPRLPDGKGDFSVVTLSLFENAVGTTNVAGTLVTASRKTASISSVSDVYIETEIKDIQLDKNSGSRFITPYAQAGTSTYLAVTIERSGGRFDPQNK